MGINPQEGTTQAFFQEFQLALINSKYGKNAGCATCGYPKNYPAKTARTVQYLLSHFGKKFLNDPFWSKYDVVIHSNSGNVPGYQAIAGNFEQWVRTSKVRCPRLHPCCTHTSAARKLPRLPRLQHPGT